MSQTTQRVIPLAAKREKDSFFIQYFYVWIGGLALIFVVTGFFFTYFLPMAKGIYPGSKIHHIHGAMYMLWIVLIISQPLLIRLRRPALHRMIGAGGLVLAVGMLLIGTAIAVISGRNAVAAGQGDFARSFLVIPLSDMLLFAIFIGTALFNLKNGEKHKRLILLATLAILPAAFGRMVGVYGIHPLVAMLLQESILILAVLHDLYTRKKISNVYLWGGSLAIIVHLFRNPISYTDTWLSFAEKIIG
jgi:hypothetical protein